jgi:hypothetical protein
MYKKFILSSIILLSVSSLNVLADTTKKSMPDESLKKPPAQIQKDQLPDTTDTGNYLETQPNENGNVNTPDCAVDSKTKPCAKSGSAQSKTLNKSKSSKEDPVDGGMDLEAK